LLGRGLHLRGRLEVETLVAAQPREDGRQVARAEELLSECADLAVDARDLLSSQRMDFFCGAIGGGVEPHGRRVAGVPVGQPHHARVILRASLGQHLVAERVAVARVAGRDPSVTARAEILLELRAVRRLQSACACFNGSRSGHWSTGSSSAWSNCSIVRRTLSRVATRPLAIPSRRFPSSLSIQVGIARYRATRFCPSATVTTG
jgi:hypothetical protein